MKHRPDSDLCSALHIPMSLSWGSAKPHSLTQDAVTSQVVIMIYHTAVYGAQNKNSVVTYHLKMSYFFLMGCPLLFCWDACPQSGSYNPWPGPSTYTHALTVTNSVCLWHLYPIQDKGRSHVFWLTKSMEDPGGHLHHYSLWILVTDVSWAEPAVPLPVSGSPLSVNSSLYNFVLPQFAHSFLLWSFCALFVQGSS